MEATQCVPVQLHFYISYQLLSSQQLNLYLHLHLHLHLHPFLYFTVSLQRPATLGSAAPPRSPTPVSSPEDVSPTGRRGRAGPEPVLSEDEQVIVLLLPLDHLSSPSPPHSQL